MYTSPPGFPPLRHATWHPVHDDAHGGARPPVREPVSWAASYAVEVHQGVVLLDDAVFQPPADTHHPRRNLQALERFDRSEISRRELMHIATAVLDRPGLDWQAAVLCYLAVKKARDPCTGYCVVPDQAYFQAFIRVCAKAGRFPEAIAALNDMVNARLNPDARSFRLVIQACEAARQWEQALALFQHQMMYSVHTGVMANNMSYCAMLKLCGRTRQPELAMGIFDHLLLHGPRFGIEPNVFTYNALLWALGESGKSGYAWAMFVHMLSMGVPRGIRPDAVSYATAVIACGPRHGDTILQHGLENGVYRELFGFDPVAGVLDIGRDQALMPAFRLHRQENSATALVIAFLKKLHGEGRLGTSIRIASDVAVCGHLHDALHVEFPELKYTLLPPRNAFAQHDNEFASNDPALQAAS